MRVGYARIDITPQESVPMGGYGNTSARMSQNVLDPLYATAIAFEADNGKRALIFTVDMIGAGGNCTTEVRPAISEATGIPMGFIQVSATHTHAGPDTLNTKIPSMERFRQYYKEQMVKVSRQALADLAEARLFITRTETKNLNFVRHYVLADGTYAGPNFGHPKLSPFVGHETEPDRTMQLAKICRKGRPDIVLCNFQVHQTDTGGVRKCGLSADIAGAMRAEVEKRTGWQFAYFTGAAGNLNPVSSIREENVIPPLDHVAHGKALARYAVAAADTFVPARFGAIRALRREHTARVNHDTDGMVPQAQEIMDYYTATNDRDGATAMAREKYGFSSVYHAKAILIRAGMPATGIIPADVLTVGDLAFVAAIYEMFDTNGMQIKESSPFPMTMLLTTANEKHIEYLPTRLTFEHGSYASDTCFYGPGIGEEMAELYVDMLNEIAEKE